MNNLPDLSVNFDGQFELMDYPFQIVCVQPPPPLRKKSEKGFCGGGGGFTKASLRRIINF